MLPVFWASRRQFLPALHEENTGIADFSLSFLIQLKATTKQHFIFWRRRESRTGGLSAANAAAQTGSEDARSMRSKHNQEKCYGTERMKALWSDSVAVRKATPTCFVLQLYLMRKNLKNNSVLSGKRPNEHAQKRSSFGTLQCPSEHMAAIQDSQSWTRTIHNPFALLPFKKHCIQRKSLKEM